MGAIGIVKNYRQLKDVDWPSFDDQDVPQWNTVISKFRGVSMGGGGTGGGSFSLGVSTGGNTLGQTGVTGTRVVLAGLGNITLSQVTDLDGGTISISAGTVAAGAAFSLGASGGNVIGATGATGTRVVLAGGNGITLSQATDLNGGTITLNGQTFSQSVQTQDRFDLSLGGNTAGALQLVSSGTLTLAGGNGITLSQAGNAVTISGAAGAETQVAISGIAASNTTYTSGTVTLVGSGNVVVQSGTGQRIIISGSQSVQPETQTFLGGLAGSNTTYTSGTVTLTGVGGGVTVSSNTGQRIDISVAAPVAQTNQAGSLFAVGNTTSSSSGTYDARTLSLRGDGIVSVAATNSGFRISASQSAQTQNLHNLTLSGNTAGVMAQISSGTVTLAGGNNITVSQNGNAVTISGANIGGAQTGISSIVASDATYTSGSVQFTGSGIVTIRSSANQRVVVDASQSLQTSNVHNVTLSGNTSGAMAQISSGTLTLAGGNNVTLSQAGNAVTISAASQTVQTQNLHNVTISGNTSGALAAISSGTLTLAGGNNITISQAGNALTISGANVGGAQTGISGIANSQTTYTSGTVSLSELGAITIRSTTGNQFQLSVAAQTAESQTIGMSNLGNTSGTTGVASGAQVRMLFAGGNNVTLSQSLNGASGTLTISAAAQTNQAGSVFAVGNTTSSSSGTYDARTLSLRGDGIISIAATNSGFRISATESVQTQNLHNVTLSGNTAGAMAQISSGTMTLAGGNNITLSQAGNAVTISGPNTAAQTGISSIAASDTTYTSGQVQFTGSGIVTVRSSANQRVVIDASQSVQAETQTFIGGISASDTLYTSGSVRFTGVGGGVTVSSNTGQRVDISVAAPVAQTVQTQNMVAVTLSGNTSGAQALISSGTLTLAGGNNITVSQAGNAVTISGAAVGGAQTGISGLANSQTTFTSGTVSLSELGAITIRSTTGNQFQLSVNAQTTQPGIQHLVVSNTTFSSGTVSLSGFGDVTVNTAANLIRISAPVQTAQTGISGLANSQTTYTSGTVSLSELGAITIRSTTGNQYQLSVNAQTEQSQSRFNLTISGNTAGAGALVSSGVLTLAGGNNITLSQAGNAITISGGAAGGFSAGVSTGGATAGDTGVTGTRLVFVATNNVTLSQATAAAGGTITISGPTTVAQTNQAGSVYAVGNTTSSSSGTYDARTLSIRGDGIISVAATNSGWRISASQSVQAETQTFVGGVAASNTTYTSGTITITGVGGGVTVSSNTGQRVDISVAAPVAQTNQSGGVYAIGNTYSSSSGTIDARTISIRGDGIISIAATNSGFRISASQSVQPETQTFLGGLANSQTTYTSGTVSLSELGAITIRSTTGNQYQLSVNAQTVQTQDRFNLTLSGNTAGAMAHISSGTLTLAGGNGITLSQAGNAVTISGGAGGGFSAGVSTGGNTLGDTGVTGTRLVIVGSNNITLSQATDANGGTISIAGQSPAGGAFSGGASNLGNTAGATGITGTQLVLVGTNAISLSQTTGANGGTLSIDAPATSSLVGVSGISISTNGSTISVMQTTGSGFMTSFSPYDESPIVTGQQGNAILHLAPLRMPEGLQMDRAAFGLYISNTTNSSNSITISQWVGMYTRTGSSISLLGSTSASTNFTGSGTVGSYSLYGGPRWMTLPWTTTIPEGDYVIGIMNRSATGGGAGHTVSQLLVSKYTNSNWSGILGLGSTVSNQRLLGQGSYSISTAALPASIAYTQILGQDSQVLRSPVFMFRSGTV